MSRDPQPTPEERMATSLESISTLLTTLLPAVEPNRAPAQQVVRNQAMVTPRTIAIGFTLHEMGNIIIALEHMEMISTTPNREVLQELRERMLTSFAVLDQRIKKP